MTRSRSATAAGCPNTPQGCRTTAGRSPTLDHRSRSARRWRRLERFETNFVDPVGPHGLLGQTAGRTSAAVVAWLDARGEDWKAIVRVVAIDPCAAYRTAVEHALPHAPVIADRFPLVRLANNMVTKVRQRVAREQLGRRGRTTDPAWTNRRLLLRAGDRLPPRALSRLT